MQQHRIIASVRLKSPDSFPCCFRNGQRIIVKYDNEVEVEDEYFSIEDYQ
jgi:hypothetical protein